MTAAIRRELMETSVHGPGALAGALARCAGPIAGRNAGRRVRRRREACIYALSRAARSRGQRSHLAFGAGESFGGGFGAFALMLSVDELDFGEADEAEDGA